MIIDRAPLATFKHRHGRAPLCWIRRVAESIGDPPIAAWEEPDIDASARPFHRVHPALPIVETITIAGSAAGLHPAPLIPLTIFLYKRTPCTGMHGHRVLGLIVDSLDDVDLPRVGPVGAGHPEGRPDAASGGRHVFEVEDDEAMGVLGFGGNADGVAAATGGWGGGGIRLDGDLIVGGGDEVRGLSGGLVDVVDVAVGWIIFLFRGDGVRRASWNEGEQSCMSLGSGVRMDGRWIQG